MKGGLHRALFVLGLLLLPLAACGSGEPQSVHGVVTEVEAASITDLDSLAIEDEKGKVWRFQGEGSAGQTPSHLREHALTWRPVTVYYRVAEDGALIVVRVTD